MAFPKGFKKQLKLVPQIVGSQRREEILDDIAEGSGFLPRGVDYEDMDKSFIDFVENDLKIEIDGEQVPVIFLTSQRYSEFTKTWKFTDKYRNISMPFISIVRQPDVQVGTNQAGLYNIPGRQNWTYYKVPSNDGARQGIDIYKVPQPTATDITYEVRFFTNKMSDLNVLNKNVQKAFNAIQYYIWPKGHPMPVKLSNVGDESNIDDFENRRFYVQNFEMLLQGYILDEDDFEVQPTVNRAMVLNEIAVEPSTAEPKEKRRGRLPVVVGGGGGSVVIRNSAGVLIAVADCGDPYVVGNSTIINSGSTFSVSVPATSGYTLPNITHIDSNGSGVTIAAMVSFTATPCENVTIINSGSTYTASTPSGSIFELPNITHYDCDGEAVTIPGMVSFSATPSCVDAVVVNSGVTYSATVAAGGTLNLPNIEVSGNTQYIFTTPSVQGLNLDITDGINPIGSYDGHKWVIGESTIYNSGSTYTENVLAEGSLELPNIKVNINSTTVYIQPSVEDVSILVSNSEKNNVGSWVDNVWLINNCEVDNSDGSWVVSIPATSAYTIPDITLFVNSDPFNTYPAAVDVSISVLDTSGVPVGSLSATTAVTIDNVSIVNSGDTFNLSIPVGNSSTLLPNITHIDSDGDLVTLPAQTPFTATTCGTGTTIINSGGTYNQYSSGGTFELPNITHYDSDGDPVTLPAQTPFTATTCSDPNRLPWVTGTNRGTFWNLYAIPRTDSFGNLQTTNDWGTADPSTSGQTISLDFLNTSIMRYAGAGQLVGFQILANLGTSTNFNGVSYISASVLKIFDNGVDMGTFLNPLTSPDGIIKVTRSSVDGKFRYYNDTTLLYTSTAVVTGVIYPQISNGFGNKPISEVHITRN